MDHTFYTDGQYFEQHPTWDVEDSPWKAAKILGILEQHALRPRSVVEVGCGAGEILAQMQRALPPETTFLGTDISPQAIALAEARHNDRLNFALAEFPTTGVPFDLVLAIDVFEHVDDPLGFLRALVSCGRHFVFHIPLDLSVQSVWRGTPIMDRRRDVGHINYYTRETALATLRDTGYAITDWQYTGSSVDRPAGSVKSWLMRLPRKLCFSIAPDWTVRVLGGYSLLVLATRGE